MIKAIMSKKDFENFFHSHRGEKVKVVSILDSDCKEDFHSNEFCSILTLRFDDVEGPERGFIPMNNTDAEKIVLFLKNWEGDVIVHCSAGISRSAGVAAGICVGKGWNEDIVWGNGKFCPNRHCYRLVCKAFGFKIDGSSFKEKEKINIEAWKREQEID